MNNTWEDESEGRIRKQDSVDLSDETVDEISPAEDTETNETER